MSASNDDGTVVQSINIQATEPQRRRHSHFNNGRAMPATIAWAMQCLIHYKSPGWYLPITIAWAMQFNSTRGLTEA